MPRYYTRVCNFYYGSKSKALVKNAKTLPLNGNNLISFDEIEIISRKSIKKLSINKINDLPDLIKRIVKKDIKLITKKKRNFKNLNLKTLPKIMGVLNITPDSFSDGGKYNKNYLAKKRLNYLFDSGADIVDIGGESTRPGSKSVSSKIEWNRIKYILNNFKVNFTFLNIVNEKNMIKRLRKRVKLNRYDKFNKDFYRSVQKGYLKLSKNKKNYQIIDSNLSIETNKKYIINKIEKLIR